MYPNPFSPVPRAQTFSAVFGILSVNNLKETKPKGSPSTVVFKNTVGRRGLALVVANCSWGQQLLQSQPLLLGSITVAI